MRRFFRSYYVINVLLILSYLATRQQYLGGDTAYGRIAGPNKLVQWEWRVIGVLPLASCIHALKAPSTDAIMADALLYGKVAVAFLAALSDWRIACCFLVAFAIAGAFLQQPHYDGPHALVRLSPSAFFTNVFDASKNPLPGAAPVREFSVDGPGVKSSSESQEVKKMYQPKDRAVWLLAMIDINLPACIQIEPVIAELSLKYTSEHLRFGVMNIAAAPMLAERLRIELGATSRQVPSLIMFEGGVEVGRIPSKNEKGKVGNSLFRRVDIVGGFDLVNVSMGTSPVAVPAKVPATARKPGKKGR